MLPPAIRFLQHFNDQSFDMLVQARDYYKFELLTMVSLGLMFQVPIGMVALNRAGILSAPAAPDRRYAIVIIAVVAALLPGRRSGDHAARDDAAAGPLPAEYPAPAWLDRRSP